ncbi:PNGase F N-terminal domain-containing protein [Chitinophaga sp.]|uniref:PNGase F N-terminal domain-containing protein n=1 Tax=Chitinophaga sp. TaxID=1869181 RepID=UPI0026043020|nr:PNGase F N-terminal domain-containing protein [uncultured Chitinophaga sp.]
MMKGILIGCAMVIATASATAQQSEAVVTYGFRNNGKDSRGEQTLLIQGKRVAVGSSGRQTEQQFLSYADKATFQLLDGKNGAFTLKKPFSEYIKPELLPGIDTVAGIPCKKAKAIIRSNTIEIWYTDALAIKGTPQISIAPGLGLILKIVRNGNSETYAKKIEYRKVSNEELKWPASWGKLVSEPAYQRQVIDSRYATISIFDQEQISWGNKIDNPSGYPLNATYHFAGGTVILKKVNLPAVKSSQRLFAELVQYSNGDAYDRTGSVFVVPVDKARSFLEGLEKGANVLPAFTGRNGKAYQGYVSTDDYDAPVEVMRLFTPFGVRHFNKQVHASLMQLIVTPEDSLTAFRGVGRKQLPSTVMGLLFHAAEHTMRHTGQLLVTVKVLKSGTTR